MKKKQKIHNRSNKSYDIYSQDNEIIRRISLNVKVVVDEQEKCGTSHKPLLTFTLPLIFKFRVFKSCHRVSEIKLAAREANCVIRY